MGCRKNSGSKVGDTFMISELLFCRYFTSFWTELLPGGDHYIKLINSGLKERYCPPLDFSEDPEKRSLINVMANELFSRIMNENLEKDVLLSLNESSKLLREIQNKSISFLSPALTNPSSHEPINETEVKVIIGICKNMISRFSENKNLVLSPKFPGCGLVENCEGDIIEETTLIEIKAGDRNFSILDIRQLLVYGALNYISYSPYKIEKFGLFNPRRGIQWSENIDVISNSLSGTTIGDLYTEIINYLSQGYGSI